MRVEQWNAGAVERKIITALIVSDAVLGRTVPKWEGRLFQAHYLNRVAEWCITHYRKYGQAPRKGIESYLEDFAATNPDQAEVDLIGKVLSAASGDYESNGDINPDHMMDVIGKYWNKVKLEELAGKIQADIQAGNIEKAEGRIAKHSRVEMGQGSGIHLLQDKDAVLSTFADATVDEQMIEYRGGLGKFFHGSMEREGFIAFCGPQKSGKSWYLMDAAIRGVEGRKRVAFFGVGDLSERQFKRRFMVRIARQPDHCDEGGWPYTVRYPTAIEAPNAKGVLANVTMENRTFDSPLDGEKAWEACKRFMRDKVKSHRSYLQISCHAVITVPQIESKLDGYILEDWVPDAVIVDYSDNLAPIDPREEPRHRVNTNWQALRALALKYHCLVVTATQVKVSAYKKETIDRTDFAEDNRKLNHVTGLVGINGSPEEKVLGISRLNWIVNRNKDYDVYRHCYVAGTLALARPAVCSVYPKKL